MAAHVYLWNIRASGVGHLSLELSDDTYISHWPGEEKGFSKVKADKRTFREDVRLEGRKPDNVLELPKGMLDEGDIKIWWKDYEADYSLVGNNCAQVVCKALVKGGIKQHAIFIVSLIIEKVVLTPADVYVFAKRCKDVYECGPFFGTVKSVLSSWWK